MAGEGSFLVEEFLGAITSQLDRTQDALIYKAENRPLTYAIKDFDMELRVFVEMDADGKIRFRPPAVGETGASSIKIGFTTITRAMIEENTLDLALTRSPTLAEAGVPEAERNRLERLGVRNTAELQRLRNTAGTDGISRMSDVPIDRLRAALAFGRPQVRDVRPAPPRPAPPKPPPVQPEPRPMPPTAPAPPTVPQPQPLPRPPVGQPRPPVQPPRPLPRPPIGRPSGPIFIPPATRRLELVGRNILSAEPQFRLGGEPLAVAEADDERVVLELPGDGSATGTLEVDYGDGDVETYELATDDPWAPIGA